MKKYQVFFAAAFFSLLPVICSASLDRDLQYGSMGEDVKELQEFLTDQGHYSGPITGNFYSLTRRALISYQSANTISPAAGYFGPKTRAKVNAALNLQLSASNEQAVVETGTVSAPTKSDAITSLQNQLNALLAQLQELKSKVKAQTDIQQQTQQSVQQIQQQTAPPTIPAPVPVPTPAPVVPILILDTEKIYETQFIMGGSYESYLKDPYVPGSGCSSVILRVSLSVAGNITFTNPETGSAMIKASPAQFVYTPYATSTIETLRFSAEGAKDITFDLKIGPVVDPVNAAIHFQQTGEKDRCVR